MNYIALNYEHNIQMQRSLDDSSLPNQYFSGISMLVQPDGPTYISLNQALELARSLDGTKKVITGITLLCDTCHMQFPHALAEKYSCRRKCSKCKAYYDICNECLAVTEICPWCHESDMKW